MTRRKVASGETPSVCEASTSRAVDAASAAGERLDGEGQAVEHGGDEEPRERERERVARHRLEDPAEPGSAGRAR